VANRRASISEKVSIHLARWVVPVTRPAVENGGVAVSQGRIVSVGQKTDLFKTYSPKRNQIVDHGDCVIMPALTNGHCHLEFSFAQGLIPEGLGFSRWLRQAMRLRQEWFGQRDEKILASAVEGLDSLLKEGVYGLADVGNANLGASILQACEKGRCCAVSFSEVIHPVEQDVVLKDGNAFDTGCGSFAFSAHSVYTCSRQAIHKIYTWCMSRGLPFSIHCSESPEEMEFVKTGQGPIAEILRERGRRIEAFFTTAYSPVRLLEEAKVLGPKTICVHCTHVDRNDLELLSKRRCHVCLCPGSNEYIGSGRAPVHEIFNTLAERVCLGTDSLASNWNLSIFSEMKRVAKLSPHIPPAQIVRAATINGAKALGFSDRLGSLEPGKTLPFLVIETSSIKDGDIYEFICCSPDSFTLKVVC